MSEAEILTMISELNKIEVKGEQNLGTLLGCIQFLRARANALREERMNAGLKSAIERDLQEAAVPADAGQEAADG